MKLRFVAFSVGFMFWFSGFGIAREHQRTQQQTYQRALRQTQTARPVRASYQQAQYGGQSQYSGQSQYGGGYRPYEMSDWQNLYYGRRPDPPSGLQYRWANTPLGPRSVPVSFDRLPPPHFYHGGHPGYYGPGGQQVVIINNGGGGYQAMDPKTAAIMGSFQTLQQVLAYIFGPKQAQAQPARQAPPTQCAEARDPCAVPQQDPRNLPSAGIILIGGSDMVRAAVEKEMLDRGQIIVANRSRAGRELHISDREYGDPWIRIELRLIDVRTSRVISATDGTVQYRAGNENHKYAAIRDAAKAAVKDLSL